ncbi:MAG: hypothetical protein K9K66_18360 [Desulfarculaceae bacterium]|nr:hypothetical protein [Desulfarculaceae bacterium]MCF8074400.1 hypothetical protein [Desulfarculaceae bacterium]MCF8103624.1 hypothetical protein [Desulfarculaceae bacterium]MCF8116037.1 hypothetical protein [Desulfarculaceae bacterium]
MDDKRLWFLLCEVALGLGVEVRLENLGGDEDLPAASGLCRLRGEPVIFVERRQGLAMRCRRLGRALTGLDLEGVYLRPAVREFLESLEPGEAKPREEI